MLDMSRGSTWAFLVSLQRSITTSLSPVILHKLHLQSYAQQQPPSFAIYNVSSSQLSIPAPTFSPATIITISALISTHALSFRQPSTYNIIHHIDIGQQTLELLLHQYMTQLSASSLSTAAKCWMSPGTNPPPPSPASFSTPGSIPPPPSVPPHSSGPTGWPTTKAPSLIDDAHDACKGWGEKRGFSKNGNGSGGRTVCPRGLSFSEFIVLMSTINCEKDNPLGQTVLPPEPFLFFRYFFPTLYDHEC